MSSAPMPKAARGAIVVALLIAAVSGLSVASGPIMLLGISFAALLSAVGMLRRRAWSALGFAFLLILAVLAILFLAITGQHANFIQTSISVVLYSALACLFLLAGHMLSLTGSKRGTPIPWILIAVLFWAPFIYFRPVTMQSNAMENTILVGDFLLVDRFSHNKPELGDVVAFHFPQDRQQILVRRIAGLPGDRIHFLNGALYRNGNPVSEPYVTHNPSIPAGPPADIVVPPGQSFLLGDARADSLDSRQWGTVALADILGKPRFIYDSLAPDPSDIKPADPKTGERFLVIPDHPPHRRWDRIFKAFLKPPGDL